MVSRTESSLYSAMARISDAEKQCSQICGKALLDASEQPLKPIDLEVGVEAALHEHSGAAHFDCLANLFVDRLEVEDVALSGHLALERPVEGAECAVLGAEIRVVDVAIDDVADDALGMEPASDGVGLHAKAYQVVGAEMVEGLLAAYRHRSSLRR